MIVIVMNDFHRQLISLLDKAQIVRGEGGSVLLFDKQFSNLKASLIVYMDTEAKQLALGHKFLYLPSFSGEDRLLFADISYTVREFSNGVDIYGYEKTIEGSTNKITLASIMGRSKENEHGNYGALFVDLVNDLKPLFPDLDLSMPTQSHDELAHIEIGKNNQFYSAGIFVVPELSETAIGQNKQKAIKYAKIDRNSIGAITDGYTFISWKEQYNTGFLEEKTMDYAHFVGYLVSHLRFVF